MGELSWHAIRAGAVKQAHSKYMWLLHLPAFPSSPPATPQHRQGQREQVQGRLLPRGRCQKEQP